MEGRRDARRARPRATARSRELDRHRPRERRAAASTSTRPPPTRPRRAAAAPTLPAHARRGAQAAGRRDAAHAARPRDTPASSARRSAASSPPTPASTRPDAFGLVGAMSPSTWWNSNVIIGDVGAMTMRAPGARLRRLRPARRTTTSDTTQLAAAYLEPRLRRGRRFSARRIKPARSTTRSTGPSASPARWRSSSARVKTRGHGPQADDRDSCAGDRERRAGEAGRFGRRALRGAGRRLLQRVSGGASDRGHRARPARARRRSRRRLANGDRPRGEAAARLGGALRRRRRARALALPAKRSRRSSAPRSRRSSSSSPRSRAGARLPDYYPDLASRSVYVLIQRDFAPARGADEVGDRARAADPRRCSPRANATSARSRRWRRLDIALDEVDGIIDFFQKDVPLAFASVKDPKLDAALAPVDRRGRPRARRLPRLSQKRSEAARARLVRDRRRGVPRQAARRRNDSTCRSTGCSPAARPSCTACKPSSRRPPRRIDPHATFAEVQRAGRKRITTAPITCSPTPRRAWPGCASFIVEHHIVTIPSPVLPKVEETPPFMRATTFASMDTPGPVRDARDPGLLQRHAAGEELAARRRSRTSCAARSTARSSTWSRSTRRSPATTCSSSGCRRCRGQVRKFEGALDQRRGLGALLRADDARRGLRRTTIRSLRLASSRTRSRARRATWSASACTPAG